MHSWLVPIGHEDLSGAILATPMSFAAAAYDVDRKDVAIGANRRWCCPPNVRFNNCYHPIAEDAVEYVRLGWSSLGVG
jgi:hypothetical protein